jgi:hypothetical protein
MYGNQFEKFGYNGFVGCIINRCNFDLIAPQGLPDRTSSTKEAIPMPKPLPIGIQSFEKLITEGYLCGPATFTV